MNTTNQQTHESLITWKRSKPSSCGTRIARIAFRIARNVLAILGVCFVYLLIVGYFQYQDAVAQPESVRGAIVR